MKDQPSSSWTPPTFAENDAGSTTTARREKKKKGGTSFPRPRRKRRDEQGWSTLSATATTEGDDNDEHHQRLHHDDVGIGAVGVGVVDTRGNIHHNKVPMRKLMGATMKIPKLLPVSRGDDDPMSNENAILGALMRKTKMRSHYNLNNRNTTAIFRRSTSDGSLGSRRSRVRSFVRRNSLKSASSASASTMLTDVTAERRAMSSLLLGSEGAEFGGNVDDGEWEDDDRSVVSTDPFEHHHADDGAMRPPDDPWRRDDGDVREVRPTAPQNEGESSPRETQTLSAVTAPHYTVDGPPQPPPPRDVSPAMAVDTTTAASSPYDFTWLNEWLDEAQLPPPGDADRITVDGSSREEAPHPPLDRYSDRKNSPPPPTSPTQNHSTGMPVTVRAEGSACEEEGEESFGQHGVTDAGHQDLTLDVPKPRVKEEGVERDEEDSGNEIDFPEGDDVDEGSWRDGRRSSSAEERWRRHVVASDEGPDPETEPDSSAAATVSDRTEEEESDPDLDAVDRTAGKESPATTATVPKNLVTDDSVPGWEGLHSARSWDEKRSRTTGEPSSSDFFFFDDDSFPIVRPSASADGFFGLRGSSVGVVGDDDDRFPSFDFAADPFGVGGPSAKDEADDAPQAAAAAVEDERSVASFDCDRSVDTCHSSSGVLRQPQHTAVAAATNHEYEMVEDEYVDHSCSTPLERLARDVETYLRKWHVADVDRHVGVAPPISRPPRRSVSCSTLPSDGAGGGLPPPSPRRLFLRRSQSVVDAIATPPRGGGGGATRVGVHPGGAGGGGGGRLLRRGHVVYQQPPGGGGFHIGSSSPRRRSSAAHRSQLRLTLSLWDGPPRDHNRASHSACSSPRGRFDGSDGGTDDGGGGTQHKSVSDGDGTSVAVPLSLRHPPDDNDDDPTVATPTTRSLDLSRAFGIGQHLTLSPTPPSNYSVTHRRASADDDNEEVMRRLPEGSITSIRDALQLATGSAGCEIPAFVLRCRYDPDRAEKGSGSGYVGDDDCAVSTIPAWVRLGNTPICSRGNVGGNGRGGAPKNSPGKRLRRFWERSVSSDRLRCSPDDGDGGRSRLVGYCTPRCEASSRGTFSLEFYSEKSLSSTPTSSSSSPSLPRITFEDVVRLYRAFCGDAAGRNDDGSSSFDGVASSGRRNYPISFVRHTYEWRKFSGSTGTSPDHRGRGFAQGHSEKSLFAVDEFSDEDGSDDEENNDSHTTVEVAGRSPRNRRLISSPTAWRDWVWTGACSTSEHGAKMDSSPGAVDGRPQSRRQLQRRILIRRWMSTLEHLVGARSSLTLHHDMMEENGHHVTSDTTSFSGGSGGTLGLLSPASHGYEVANDLSNEGKEYLWGPRYDPMKVISLSLSWAPPSLMAPSSSAPSRPLSGAEKNQNCASTTEGDLPTTNNNKSPLGPQIPHANLRELPFTPRNLPPDTTAVRCHRDTSDDLAPCPLSAQLRCAFAAYIYTSTELPGDVMMSNFVYGRRREHNAGNSGGSDDRNMGGRRCFRSYTGTTTANLVDALADMVASDGAASAPSRGDEIENIVQNIRSVMQYGNLWWAGTASEEACSGTVRSTEEEAIGSSEPGVLNVHDVRSSNRSHQERTCVGFSVPRERPLPPRCCNHIVDPNHLDSIFLLSHSAPPGGLLSLLCFQMMHLVKSPVSICQYWLLFLQEVRDYWHQGTVIPNLGLEMQQALGSSVLLSPFAPAKRKENVYSGQFGGQVPPDTTKKRINESNNLSNGRIDRSFCLLEQKLQVVNIGIEAASSLKNCGRCSPAATVEESPFVAESMEAHQSADFNRQLETEVHASGAVASLTPDFSLKLLSGEEQESVTSDDNSSIANDPSCDEAVKIGPAYCRDDDNVDDINERHSSCSGLNSLPSKRSGSFSTESDAYDTADEAESDEVDAEYTYSDTTKDGAHRQRIGARRPVQNLFLKANGSQVYEPYLQPPLPLTTDLCIQRRVMMAQQDDILRCSNRPRQPSSNNGTADSLLGNRLRVAHHYQRPKLSSDMSAFKAANPGSTFEDFLRWYGNPGNPLEEYEDGEDHMLLDTLLNGVVSADVDFSVSNSSVQSLCTSSPARENLNADEATRIGALEAIEILNATRKFWFDTWEDSESIPSSGQQSSLFDPVQEVESVLHFLESLHPSQLLNHVLAINLSTAATFLATAAGPIRNVGTVDVAIDRLMRCTQHALDQLMEEYHRSSLSIDHVEAASSFHYYISPKTLSACEAACDCVGECEMLLSRATSLLHKFPGEYELVQEMLGRKDGEETPVMSTENRVESKLNTFLQLISLHEAPWLHDLNEVDVHEKQTFNANVVPERSKASLASPGCGPIPSIREYTIRNSDIENPRQLFVQIHASATSQQEGNQQESNNVILALKRCSKG